MAAPQTSAALDDGAPVVVHVVGPSGGQRHDERADVPGAVEQPERPRRAEASATNGKSANGNAKNMAGQVDRVGAEQVLARPGVRHALRRSLAVTARFASSAAGTAPHGDQSSASETTKSRRRPPYARPGAGRSRRGCRRPRVRAGCRCSSGCEDRAAADPCSSIGTTRGIIASRLGRCSRRGRRRRSRRRRGATAAGWRAAR